MSKSQITKIHDDQKSALSPQFGNDQEPSLRTVNTFFADQAMLFKGIITKIDALIKMSLRS